VFIIILVASFTGMSILEVSDKQPRFHARGVLTPYGTFKVTTKIPTNNGIIRDCIEMGISDGDRAEMKWDTTHGDCKITATVWEGNNSIASVCTTASNYAGADRVSGSVSLVIILVLN
jgi:hypothetical protein